jgi:D-sedoheptulose 7-phosphate isomerase
MAFDSKKYIDTYKETSSRITQQFPTADIKKAVDLIHTARKRGSHVFTIGNGGSASTASHFAGDLFKWATANGKAPIKAFCLTDNIPLISALTNDDGWSEIFTEQLKTLAQPGDVIVGFSVHGGSGKENAGVWSQNLTKAMHYVQQIGGSAIGITGFDGGAMKDLCDVHINVPVTSTAHVEGLHLVVSHMIVDTLKEIALHEHEQSTGKKDTHRK